MLERSCTVARFFPEGGERVAGSSQTENIEALMEKPLFLMCVKYVQVNNILPGKYITERLTCHLMLIFHHGVPTYLPHTQTTALAGWFL